MTEVVAALIWEGETFLICQRPAHKARGLLWEFVGGKVEPGETREEALVRECREELDIRVAVGEPFMEVIPASLRSAHYSGKNEGPFAAPAACPAGREAHW